MPAHPGLVLGLVGVLTAAALGVLFDLETGATRLRIDPSVDRLLPEHDADRAFYDRVREVFGTDETLLLAVVADDVFVPEQLERIERMRRRIAALDGVHHVLALTNAVDVRGVGRDIEIAPFVKEVPRDPAALVDLRQRVMANPIYAGNLVSRDGRAAALVVYFMDMSHQEYLASGLDDEIVAIAREESGDAHVWVTGGPHIRAETARILLRETLSLPLLVLACLALVLLIAYRTLHGVLVPLATIAISVIWTMALVVLLGYELNAVTALVPPLLTTLGLSYAVHVVSEVEHERAGARAGGPAPVATALGRVALPVFLTGLTTAVGFASLGLSPLAAVREFGLISVLGVVVTLVASLTFTPAALAILRGAPRQRDDARGGFARLAERLARFDLERRRWIFAGALVLFAVSLLGVREMRVGTEQVRKFRPDAPVRVHFEAVNESLEGANLMFVVLETDVAQGFTEPADLGEIAALQDWLEAQPEIGGTTSLVDYVELLNRGFHGNDPEYLRVPPARSTVSQLLLFGASDELDAFVDRRFQITSIRVRSKVIDSDDVADLTRRIEARLSRLPPRMQASVTGTSVVFNRALDEIIRGQTLSVVAALGIIYGILALMFLSPRIGLIALIPNVLPVAAYFGALGLLGVRLNPGTSLVAPMVLGIAVDDTIHYFARFIRDARRLADERRATASALRAVGRPVTYTSLALCAGFLVLNGSALRTQAELGNMAALALALAWLCDMLLTPALCARLRIATLWDALAVDLGSDPQRTLDAMRGLRESQARVVAALASMLEVRAGERLFAAGEPGEAFYVVVSGRLRACLATPGGAVELATHARGATVGEVGVFFGHRTADVDVLEDARLLRVSSRALDHLGRRYPRIASVLLRNLNETLASRLSLSTRRYLEQTGAAPVPPGIAVSEKALEDVAFQRVADVLRARLREGSVRLRAGGDGALDAPLVERLERLGVGADTLTALALIPLVEVAWADGRLDASERRAVLEGAEACGIEPGSASGVLLSLWLEQTPPEELHEGWRQLVGAICRELSVEARLRLERAIVGRARAVAEAAGGVMGFGAVSRSEERVLERLGDAFRAPAS